ncbi:MAG: hypothetical protein ABR524_03685 [Thermoanaerobaculia bacterium]
MRAQHAVLVLLLTACGHVTPQAVGIVPGEEFVLSVAESAALPGEGLLEFAQVVADSRCPVDVQCVWAGDAVVALRASDVNDSASLRLHTGGPRSASFGTWEVELVELRPLPREGMALTQADYEAVLRLREAVR